MRRCLKKARSLAACLGLACSMAAMIAAVGGGCTSTPSDIPWNSRQSWEGSPSIPGFGGSDGF